VVFAAAADLSNSARLARDGSGRSGGCRPARTSTRSAQSFEVI